MWYEKSCHGVIYLKNIELRFSDKNMTAFMFCGSKFFPKRDQKETKAEHNLVELLF